VVLNARVVAECPKSLVYFCGKVPNGVSDLTTLARRWETWVNAGQLLVDNGHAYANYELFVSYVLAGYKALPTVGDPVVMEPLLQAAHEWEAVVGQEPGFLAYMDRLLPYPLELLQDGSADAVVVLLRSPAAWPDKRQDAEEPAVVEELEIDAEPEAVVEEEKGAMAGALRVLRRHPHAWKLRRKIPREVRDALKGGS